jgi:hypothetical protein
MNEIMTAEYYGETSDERVAGKVALRTDTIVAAYQIPKFPKRTMLMTEHGLKFCVKGKVEDFDFNCGSNLLSENS